MRDGKPKSIWYPRCRHVPFLAKFKIHEHDKSHNACPPSFKVAVFHACEHQ